MNHIHPLYKTCTHPYRTYAICILVFNTYIHTIYRYSISIYTYIMRTYTFLYKYIQYIDTKLHHMHKLFITFTFFYTFSTQIHKYNIYIDYTSYIPYYSIHADTQVHHIHTLYITCTFNAQKLYIITIIFISIHSYIVTQKYTLNPTKIISKSQPSSSPHTVVTLNKTNKH